MLSNTNSKNKAWHEQNGRLGGSKISPSVETLKDKRKLSEPALSELWKDRRLQQPSRCWIKKKITLRMGGKLCAIFYLPLPHSLLSLLATMNKVVCIPLEVLVPGYRGKIAYRQVIRALCSNLSGDYRDCARGSSLFHLIQNLVKAENSIYPWKYCKANKQPTVTGSKKLQLRHKITICGLEGKLGSVYLENYGIQKYLCLWKI